MASSLAKKYLHHSTEESDQDMSDIFLTNKIINKPTVIKQPDQNQTIHFSPKLNKNSPKAFNKHPKVESNHYGNATYTFTGRSVVEAAFGFLDGALNALPRGGFLSTCGVKLKESRQELLNMTEDITRRELIPIMDRYYNLLGFTYDLTYNCYYGIAEFLTVENLELLWLRFDILKNIMFNIGYMYTDIVMLSIGVPGQTQSDYMYYLFFYIGDLTFRLFFRSESSPTNCWYPWNSHLCL